MVIYTLTLLAAITLPHPAQSPRPKSKFHVPQIAAGDLYAARVRRRMASYLRMRLLELRKAGLDRAAEVVEHRLPVDKLFEH
jgi:hypothetical protein